MPPSLEGPIEINHDCGLDLFAEGVPTIAVIGPSRRGKSVLASLLGGGDPKLFLQSHSSFKAMTSGTHACEVPGLGPKGLPLRIVDTEGLSHVGRSRTKEALVRQFLISTYLTSSWLIWLDTEVLSSNFFTMMWLVYDYVVDVLKVRDAAGHRLPSLTYIRTQETPVQQKEYSGQFATFGDFFQDILQEHEDAPVLRQMFRPNGIHGHALPVWTPEDLAAFEGHRFWLEEHSSSFKDSVRSLRSVLLDPAHMLGDKEEERPPLLSFAALEPHLSKVAHLEAFDPRDHETTKVARLRSQLRASYGRPGSDDAAEALRLAEMFDPTDRAVRAHGGQIDLCAKTKIKDHCKSMRLEVEVAEADPEVSMWLERFGKAAPIFNAAVHAFLPEDLVQTEVLRKAVTRWGLDPVLSAAELKKLLAAAEEEFLAATSLGRPALRQVALRERLSWRLDECVLRLRGKVASKMLLRRDGHETLKEVWRLGKWQGSGASDGKGGKAKDADFALWTDGLAWELYEERWATDVGGGSWLGIFRESGTIGEGCVPLPVPAVAA